MRRIFFHGGIAAFVKEAATYIRAAAVYTQAAVAYAHAMTIKLSPATLKLGLCLAVTKIIIMSKTQITRSP